MRKKLFVVEARRLLPLLFLLVLLISLSVYDTFRTSPTVVPEEAKKADVKITTVDKGERQEQPTFRLVTEQDGWAETAGEWGVTLPQYPFQPQHEVALFVLHADVQKVEAQARGEGEMEVRVTVGPKRDHYQVVTMPVKDVLLEGGQTTWTFADKRGNILGQLTVGEATETIAEEEVPLK